MTFEEGTVAYDHRDAEGFIKLNALRLRTLGQRKKKMKLSRTRLFARLASALACARLCLRDEAFMESLCLSTATCHRAGLRDPLARRRLARAGEVKRCDAARSRPGMSGALSSVAHRSQHRNEPLPAG